jgi:hypothetical protein
MKKIRGMYRIYVKPVRLEKVIDGLWVAPSGQAPAETEDEYFGSAELFKVPMSKPRSVDDSQCLKTGNR